MHLVPWGLDRETQVSPVGVRGGQLHEPQTVPIPSRPVTEDDLDPAVGGAVDAGIGTRIQLHIEADVGVERLGIHIGAEAHGDDRLAVAARSIREVVRYAHGTRSRPAAGVQNPIIRHFGGVGPVFPGPQRGFSGIVEIVDDDFACLRKGKTQQEHARYSE